MLRQSQARLSRERTGLTAGLSDWSLEAIGFGLERKTRIYEMFVLRIVTGLYDRRVLLE